MFFSKKSAKQEESKPVKTYYYVRVHLSGRAQRIWSWDFDEVNAEEEARKFHASLVEKVNNSKDGDYVSLSPNLTVRRDHVVEIIVS